MKAIIFLLILSSFISCVDEPKSNNFPPIIESQEIDLLDTLSLKLNDGKKWIVNKETHVGLKNMDSIVKEFNSNSNNDYQSLGQSLSKQTGFVIKNCTMQGEPHNQLHVVLVPMLDEISILKETTSASESAKALSNLKLLIHNYFTYFKL